MAAGRCVDPFWAAVRVGGDGVWKRRGSGRQDRPDFDARVAGYRPGADMEHGYGRTRMSTKSASPLRTCQTQRAAMGATVASLPVAERRERLAASMTAARVTRPAVGPQRPAHRQKPDGFLVSLRRNQRRLP